MSSDLREATRVKILDYLTSGRLEPGERLVERSLAQEIGVSRIPLREVMAQLVTRGVLVRNKGNGGVFVRMHSADEARQVFELREAIEVGAARAAARRANESDLIRLEIICEQMAAQVGNYGSPDWAELDKSFHEAVIAASRNDRFIHDYDILISETHVLFYRRPAQALRPAVTQQWAIEHMRGVVVEHQTIVDAIRSGDLEKTESLIRFHIQKAATYVTRVILEQELQENRLK